MDWIRRNWPDLLIGLALLAVIAGIIATLLNGGSFLSGGSRAPASPPAASATTRTTEPVAPDASAPGDNAGPETQGTVAQEPAEVPSIDTAPTESASVATDATTPATTGPDIPVISSADSEATPADTAATAPAATAAAPVTASPAEAAPDGVTSRTVSDVESAYRILVGSFGNADNALRRAQTFADANFPTFTATQGDLTLVLVGPFDNQSDAESAFNRIQSEGLETAPLLFEPTGGAAATSEAAAVTETRDNATVAVTPATSDQADPQTPADASAAGGESYLQTGAYGSSESAQPQRERLEDLGFNVSEVQEGSFVKLLVGPFSADELSAAQSRLSAQGIDYFVRSN